MKENKLKILEDRVREEIESMFNLQIEMAINNFLGGLQKDLRKKADLFLRGLNKKIKAFNVKVTIEE